jgi:cytochrome c-type biogenesis protein CcmH
MYLAALIILVLIALGIILFPYLKGRQEVEIIPPDIAVYKAQLRELDSDIEKGLIDETEAKRSRIEIERRLLKAAGEQQKKVSIEKSAHFITVLLGLIILFSGYFYYLIGTPAMPDFPKSLDQFAQLEGAQAEQIEQFKTMKGRVIARLDEFPEEAEGWAYFANLEMNLGNFQSAAQALYRAHILKPDEFEYQLLYAESLIMAADERVTPAAQVILNKAAVMSPDHPGIRYFLGLADYQAGEIEVAYETWMGVRADLPDQDPLLPLIDVWLGRAANQLDIAVNLPEGRAPSINPEQAEIIRNMSEGEQQELILQMVAQLAAKQEENPTNIQGWIQLSRSYLVLGQRENAIAAMQAAVDNAPVDQKDMLQKEVEKLTNMP